MMVLFQGYLNKHGSGVARKQKRVPSPELRLADGTFYFENMKTSDFWKNIFLHTCTLKSYFEDLKSIISGDPNKLPILIETPPPPKQERRDSESSASDGRATGQGESMVTMD